MNDNEAYEAWLRENEEGRRVYDDCLEHGVFVVFAEFGGKKSSNRLRNICLTGRTFKTGESHG